MGNLCFKCLTLSEEQHFSMAVDLRYFTPFQFYREYKNLFRQTKKGAESYEFINHGVLEIVLQHPCAESYISFTYEP